MADIQILSSNQLPIFILGIYRPPNAPLESSTLTALANAIDGIPLKIEGLFFLVRDFNVDCMNKRNKNTILQQVFFAAYDIEQLDLLHAKVIPTSATSIDAVWT